MYPNDVNKIKLKLGCFNRNESSEQASDVASISAEILKSVAISEIKRKGK